MCSLLHVSDTSRKVILWGLWLEQLLLLWTGNPNPHFSRLSTGKGGPNVLRALFLRSYFSQLWGLQLLFVPVLIHQDICL